jgi:hypothetical protein
VIAVTAAHGFEDHSTREEYLQGADRCLTTP